MPFKTILALYSFLFAVCSLQAAPSFSSGKPRFQGVKVGQGVAEQQFDLNASADENTNSIYTPVVKVKTGKPKKLDPPKVTFNRLASETVSDVDLDVNIRKSKRAENKFSKRSTGGGQIYAPEPERSANGEPAINEDITSDELKTIVTSKYMDPAAKSISDNINAVKTGGKGVPLDLSVFPTIDEKHEGYSLVEKAKTLTNTITSDIKKAVQAKDYTTLSSELNGKNTALQMFPPSSTKSALRDALGSQAGDIYKGIDAKIKQAVR